MNGDDHIGELLKLAGHRHMPDAEQMSRARAAARSEWTQVIAHRRRRFPVWALGTAALVAIMLVAVTLFRSGGSVSVAVPVPVRGAEIAMLDTVIGTLLVTEAGSTRSVTTATGARLRAGDRLETPGGSRAGLALSRGALLKLDEHSTVALDADGGLTLSRGALFVDAGPDSRDPDLHVKTPFGVVRHVGTQFEVRLQSDTVRVRVREGTVAVTTGEGRWTSQEGEALLLANGVAPERRPIATYGSEWSWLDQLAPPFTLEGSTVGAFLQWITRHHGLRWQYEDPTTRDRIERIVLHGSIEGLTAEEALAAVLPTCGLTFRRLGDLFVIGKPAM